MNTKYNLGAHWKGKGAQTQTSILTNLYHRHKNEDTGDNTNHIIQMNEKILSKTNALKMLKVFLKNVYCYQVKQSLLYTPGLGALI